MPSVKVKNEDMREKNKGSYLCLFSDHSTLDNVLIFNLMDSYQFLLDLVDVEFETFSFFHLLHI